MKKYIVRMLRYILKMAVLLAVVFAILSLTNTLNTHGGRFAEVLFLSKRGLILMGALLIIAAVYPRLAFTTIDLRGDFQLERETIVEAMRSLGYSPVRQNDKRIIFRADKFIKKLTAQWSDDITVSADGGFISIEGMKKELVKIEPRIIAFRNNRQS